MTRTETERLAVLEVEMKHATKANEEMAATLKQALSEISAMRKEQAAVFNQLRGGKLMLSVMLATASGFGATIMWVLKEMLPMFLKGS